MKLPGKRDQARKSTSGRHEPEPAPRATGEEEAAPVAPEAPVATAAPAPEAQAVSAQPTPPPAQGKTPVVPLVLVALAFAAVVAAATRSTTQPPTPQESKPAVLELKPAPSIKKEEPKPTEPDVRVPLRAHGAKGEAFDRYEAAAAALPVLEPRLAAALNAWTKTPAEPLPKALFPLLEKASVALGELAKGADAESATPKPVSQKLGHGSLLLARLALARARCELEGGAQQIAVERALEVVRLGQDLARTEGTALLGSALTNEAAKALEAWLAKAPNLPREAITRVLRGSPRTNATYARALARIEALLTLKKGKAS